MNLRDQISIGDKQIFCSKKDTPKVMLSEQDHGFTKREVKYVFRIQYSTIPIRFMGGIFTCIWSIHVGKYRTHGSYRV